MAAFHSFFSCQLRWVSLLFPPTESLYCEHQAGIFKSIVVRSVFLAVSD